MLNIAKFFTTFYGFSTAYKHGFLIYPAKLHETGENVIGELSWNNLMNFILIDKIPYNIDAVIYIIFCIFSQIIGEGIKENGAVNGTILLRSSKSGALDPPR